MDDLGKIGRLGIEAEARRSRVERAIARLPPDSPVRIAYDLATEVPAPPRSRAALRGHVAAMLVARTAASPRETDAPGGPTVVVLQLSWTSPWVQELSTLEYTVAAGSRGMIGAVRDKEVAWMALALLARQWTGVRLGEAVLSLGPSHPAHIPYEQIGRESTEEEFERILSHSPSVRKVNEWRSSGFDITRTHRNLRRAWVLADRKLWGWPVTEAEVRAVWDHADPGERSRLADLFHAVR